MSIIIGRSREIRILENAVKGHGEATFVALYGRRRVGKTYLVRELFSERGPYFSVTGRRNGDSHVQLGNFQEAMQKTFGETAALQSFANWHEAFNALSKAIDDFLGDQTIVLFFDELPWLATPRSGLVDELDHFWNIRWSKDKRIRLIACGSAAAWMMSNLIYAKGGLHNRLTKTIRLQPLDLAETREYLGARGADWPEEMVTELFMTTGGIPFYLNDAADSFSPIEAVQSMCFESDGLLYREFDVLFSSLFRKSEKHTKIVRALSSQRYGVSRDNLLLLTGLSSGSGFKRPMSELIEAGFVQRYLPYGRQNKGHHYRLIDEYSLFFLRWIDGVRERIAGLSRHHWQSQSQTQAWRIWSGYAFEGICYKHADAILRALGISGVQCEIGNWNHKSSGDGLSGAQIDMLIDRADKVISVCEIKYSNGPYVIDKKCAEKIRNKLSVFQAITGTRKILQPVFITTFGLKRNKYTDSLRVKDVRLTDLFMRDHR